MTRTRLRRAVAALVLLVGLAAAQPAFADTATFSNSNPVTFCVDEPSQPQFPTTIDVSGVVNPITKLTVGLGQYGSGSNKNDLLLASPAGKTVLIMSDAAAESSGDFTIDDSASDLIPEMGAPGGTYRPTDYDPGTNSDTFPAGVPTEPYGTQLSSLIGDSPNGTWKLYIAQNPDDTLGSCVPDGALASWSLSFTTSTPEPPPPPPPPPPNPEPTPTPTPDPTPPNPLTPPDPTAPQVQTADFSSPPVAGESTFLQVVARDLDTRVTGLIVDFGETLGVWAESACVEGQANTGGTVQFDVPFTYLSPGPHTLTVTVLSGGCGTAQIGNTFTQVVNVGAAARKARAGRKAHASVTIPGPTVTSKCKDANLDPTPGNSKRIVKALLCVMNEQRKKYRLKPLKNSPRLGKAALAHTRSMISGKFFAHQGPKEPALKSRLRKVKFRASAGENIGAGGGELGTAVGMVNGWMHSKLHKANLLSKKWKFVGIGFLAQFPLPSSGRPVATYTTDFGPKK